MVVCSYSCAQVSRAREVTFQLPARAENTPHRSEVVRITDTLESALATGSGASGNLVALSLDGLVSFWSPQLDLKKTKSIIVRLSLPPIACTLCLHCRGSVFGTCEIDKRLSACY